MAKSKRNSGKKKQKIVDAKELATKLWEHYNNYLESCGDESEGDADELNALLKAASDHVKHDPDSGNILSLYTDKNLRESLDTVVMLPILASVAHYHLADAAISDYLQEQADKGEDAEETDQDPTEDAWTHLSKALTFYPAHAGAWSMGANFGRMSKRLPPPAIREWYQQAVDAAQSLRSLALELLEDENVDTSAKEWIELLLLHQVLGVEFIDEDDNDNEEDAAIEKKDSDGEDKEENGYYSCSTVESTSRFMCAMLSSTAGDHDVALEHLKHFPLTHRIHPNVWKSSGTTATQKAVQSKSLLFEPCAFRPSAGILPKDLYGRLLKVFGPNGAFWGESDYSNRGYYSFFSSLPKKDAAPSNIIEEAVVCHLLPRAQHALKEAGQDDKQICGYEWWTHTRPIQANLGHNLHFDTDESMLALKGEITHPIVSSVLYLTGGSDENEAGPTIVFNQAPNSSEVGTHCWKSTPHDNTCMIFPGNLLHGVLPCPGKVESQISEPSDNTKSPATPTELIGQWNSSGGKSTKDKQGNRLTMLVGFWTRDVPKTMQNRHLYGPCGPLPPATEEHSWASDITTDSNKSPQSKPGPAEVPSIALPVVTPAWESIESSVPADEEEKAMQLPHGIDHRFFVKDAPKCFYNSLMEDRDEEQDE